MERCVTVGKPDTLRMVHVNCCCAELEKLIHPQGGLGIMRVTNKTGDRFILLYQKDWHVPADEAGIQQMGSGYFESVGLDSFAPVTKNQNMKAHQIASRRSRRTAALVTGLTNKNTGVRIRSGIPQNIFTLALW